MGSTHVKPERKYAGKIDTRCQFQNTLRTAFALVDPESIKITVKSSVPFTLLGSTHVKAEGKYVGEIGT